MPLPDDETRSSQAPKSGLRLMLVIGISTALLALYANIQKGRHGRIEKVTITPVTPSPSASPSPNQ